MPQETEQKKQDVTNNIEQTIDPYTGELKPVPEDEDIEADFAERQQLAVGGRDELLEELDEHHSLSPEISGGDLDASWQTANATGEEAVGGSAPTPDQDVVDELGTAAGLIYEDDEPLNSDAKILDRDRNRWELNPASAQDEDEENNDGNMEDEGDFEDLEALENDELDNEEDDEDDSEDDDSEDDDEEDEYIDAELEDEEDRDM